MFSVRLCLALIQVQKDVSEVNDESSRRGFSYNVNLFSICALMLSFFPRVRKFSHIPSCNYPVFAPPVWLYHLLMPQFTSSFVYNPPLSPLKWHQPSHPRCPLKKYEIQSSCGVSTQPWTVIMTSLLCSSRAKCVAQAFHCIIPNASLSLATEVIWESPTGQLQCKWG